jgi:hypothetical protein
MEALGVAGLVKTSLAERVVPAHRAGHVQEGSGIGVERC